MTLTLARIPYPAIEKHGVIGDQRTAAMVAADGTLDWMCLPDFDSDIVFGALLDWAKGGHWRLGPARPSHGAQSYLDDCMVLKTRWESEAYTGELTEAMLWPEWERAPEQRQLRVVVRSLRCVRGKLRAVFDLAPRLNFADGTVEFEAYASGTSFDIGAMHFRIWVSHPVEAAESRLHGEFELGEGEELWTVLEMGNGGHGWTVESARKALGDTIGFWRSRSAGLRSTVPSDLIVRQSAAAVSLMTYAPSGSVVAAPTTSLPERIGGTWNADYRYAWVRDASLAAGMAATLGLMQETENYLQWIVGRLSRFGRPLQVVYGVRGESRLKPRKLGGVAGYRDSSPVKVGNHAYKQHQLGSLGHLADCLWTYLDNGGSWRGEYGKLIERLASYTIEHWHDVENGIWELPVRQHYVSSKVLNWVALDRAILIAERFAPSTDVGEWKAEKGRIHDEVMERGWSEARGSFRQRYDAEALDASSLLVSVCNFLPGDHPRVLATIERTVADLSIDGFVYRFDPRQTPGLEDIPLGQYEGAFLPATFWLATAYAKSGQFRKAKEILDGAEAIAGPLGLFGEGVDPRNRAYLGNFPLLFSHVEYVRARLELAREGAAPRTEGQSGHA